MSRRTIKRFEGLVNQGIGGSGSVRQPFFMREMSNLLRYSNIDELI